MINKKQIIEILEGHIENITDHLDRTFEVIEVDDFCVKAEKIIALGKQKPLAKNKQNENKCECKQSTFTRIVTEDFEPQCGKCWKPI